MTNTPLSLTDMTFSRELIAQDDLKLDDETVARISQEIHEHCERSVKDAMFGQVAPSRPDLDARTFMEDQRESERRQKVLDALEDPKTVQTLATSPHRGGDYLCISTRVDPSHMFKVPSYDPVMPTFETLRVCTQDVAVALLNARAEIGMLRRDLRLERAQKRTASTVVLEDDVVNLPVKKADVAQLTQFVEDGLRQSDHAKDWKTYDMFKRMYKTVQNLATAK